MTTSFRSCLPKHYNVTLPRAKLGETFQIVSDLDPCHFTTLSRSIQSRIEVMILYDAEIVAVARALLNINMGPKQRMSEVRKDPK